MIHEPDLTPEQLLPPPIPTSSSEIIPHSTQISESASLSPPIHEPVLPIPSISPISSDVEEEEEIEGENENELKRIEPQLPLKRISKPNPRYNISTVSIEDGLEDEPELVEKAMIEELSQLQEIKAFKPIHLSQATTRIIPSKMIVKKKVNSQGKITKVKARLCAGGHRQDKLPPTITSSPTVSKFSIMTICTIAAMQQRKIATADIKGAYLEAKLKTKVFMKVDKRVSKLFVKLFPQFKRFLVNGELSVQLISALYGCQSSGSSIANIIIIQPERIDGWSGRSKGGRRGYVISVLTKSVINPSDIQN